MKKLQFNGVDSPYFNNTGDSLPINKPTLFASSNTELAGSTSPTSSKGISAESIGKALEVGSTIFSTTTGLLDRKEAANASKSERQREKDLCAKNKAFRGQGTKKRRQLILDCQNKVDERYDRQDALNAQIALKSQDAPKTEDKKPNYVLWGGIGVGVLAVLAIGGYFLTRKK